MSKRAKIYSKRKSQKTTNGKGYPVGESHQRSRWSDHEVELVLALHESGMPSRQIAAKLDIPRRTVRDYLAGKCRCQTAGV